MDDPTEHDVYLHAWTIATTLTVMLLLRALTDPKLPRPILVALSYLW